MTDAPAEKVPVTFLVLGGAGNTGSRVARLLLAECDGARVVLAGRNQGAVGALARELGEVFGAERCGALRVDASDPVSVRAGLEGVDMLVVASSTARHVETVIDAAIDARVDYLDTQYSSVKVERLAAAAPRLEAAGVCAVTDAGFHPGVPAALPAPQLAASLPNAPDDSLLSDGPSPSASGGHGAASP